MTDFQTHSYTSPFRVRAAVEIVVFFVADKSEDNPTVALAKVKFHEEKCFQNNATIMLPGETKLPDEGDPLRVTNHFFTI